MPVYFSNVAPTCPVSSDQPAGPDTPYNYSRHQFIRPTIPKAFDFNSAILAANNLRQIMLNLINNPVRNNVIPGKQGKESVGKDKFKNKTARWVEQKSKRVKRKYKYYGKKDDGTRDNNSWVIMERIERMVWYDRAWKTYLIWEYGDKGEGVPVGGDSPSDSAGA